jgi:predicted transcriptional regulator
MHAQDPVNRIMTEAVLSVEAGAPAGEVLRLFSAYPIHHLPVVDGGVVVGMLGSTDLMKIDMLLPKGGVSPVEYLNQRMTVRQLVRRPPVVIGERQSVEEAAALMAKHSIHALPVINTHSHLVGIVTTTDIMHAALGSPCRHEAAAADATTGQAAEPLVPRFAPADLSAAVSAARCDYVAGADPQGIAAALLFLHHRVALLEPLRQAAERYLAAGQDEHLHAVLLKAVEAARDAEPGSGGEAHRPFGLGG